MFRLLRILGRDCGGEALWRRVALAFTLVTFALAGYATQTHIHVPAELETAETSASHPGHGNKPADDPAHCPLCQEYLLSGAYVVPAPIVLPLPAPAEFQAPRLVHELSFVGAVSHSWNSRGPPAELTLS
ncbi:MAG TPA: hypothetical protein VHX61_10870 [Rhizomicrobium sp.]|nr:hypothetical protein [Rhizomicrobium sp.]